MVDEWCNLEAESEAVWLECTEGKRTTVLMQEQKPKLLESHLQ